MCPEQPHRADRPERPASSRPAWMVETLRAAVARACPSALASHREDLVQTALLRVLERERADEQDPIRTASYLWRVAFSVVADELRKRRTEAGGLRETNMTEERGEEHGAPSPELGLAIRECVSQLSESRRLAVLLHLQGFRAEEATRVLHWNTKRIQNLTYRGLADLRWCLSQKGLLR